MPQRNLESPIKMKIRPFEFDDTQRPSNQHTQLRSAVRKRRKRSVEKLNDWAKYSFEKSSQKIARDAAFKEILR